MLYFQRIIVFCSSSSKILWYDEKVICIQINLPRIGYEILSRGIPVTMVNSRGLSKDLWWTYTFTQTLHSGCKVTFTHFWHFHTLRLRCTSHALLNTKLVKSPSDNISGYIWVRVGSLVAEGGQGKDWYLKWVGGGGDYRNWPWCLVCPGVVGTAIWHSTRCASYCIAALASTTSVVPDNSSNHASTDV